MKRIGLLSDISDDGRINLNLAYFRFIERLGYPITIIHPLEERADPDLAALCIIGGADVHPYRYQQPKHPLLCGNQNTNFEYWDVVTLPKYIANKTPLISICRGFQTLNVHFGGTLNQHVNEPTGTNRSDLVHYAEDPRTGEVILVTSLHHQSIDKLADGFDITLQGFKMVKKKGRVNLCLEGFRHRELPIVGWQMHPEEYDLSDEKAVKGFNWVMKEIYSILK